VTLAACTKLEQSSSFQGKQRPSPIFIASFVIQQQVYRRAYSVQTCTITKAALVLFSVLYLRLYPHLVLLQELERPRL
jgi:hypothetical protein